MDAFPRRNRNLPPQGETAVAPVLSPLQLSDLFAARVEALCAGFAEWGFPLIVAGELGEEAGLMLIDRRTRAAVALEMREPVLAASGVQAGDRVLATGLLRARVMKGNVTPVFEALALEPYDPVQRKAAEAEASLLERLRGLDWGHRPYPRKTGATLLVIVPPSAQQRLRESLGGAWQAARLRLVTISPAETMPGEGDLAGIIRACREDVLLFVPGATFPPAALEEPAVLEALSACHAHRVLCRDVSGRRLLIESLADHVAPDFDAACAYLRRMNGRLWQEEEEARSQGEEIAALRETVAALSVPARRPVAGRILSVLLAIALGAVLGWAAGRFG